MTMQDRLRIQFNAAINQATIDGNADRITNLELCREYFCNPPFRKALEDYVYAITTTRKDTP